MSKNKSNGFTNWSKTCECKRVYVPLWEPINPLCEQYICLGLLSTDLLLYSTYVIVLQLCPYTWNTAVPKYESILTRNFSNPNRHTLTSFRYRIASCMGQILLRIQGYLMIFNFRWNYENLNLSADLVQGRGWRMCGVLAPFLRMILSFALPKVNVFIQCKISFKILKDVAHCIRGNILNSNINKQIIKELLCLP